MLMYTCNVMMRVIMGWGVAGHFQRKRPTYSVTKLCLKQLCEDDTDGDEVDLLIEVHSN